MLVALLTLAVGACLYRLNAAVPLNSDQAASLLEGRALLSGNLLLHGWALPTDTFYTSKVPLLALLTLVHGFTTRAVPESAAVLGTLLALVGAWLAFGRRGRRFPWGAAITLLLLVVPAYATGHTQLLPGGTDHAGTLVLILLGLVAVDAEELSWWRFALLGLALFLATVGDPAALAIGGAAVGLTALVRLAGRRDWHGDLALAATAALSSGLALVALHEIRVAGGFQRNAQNLSLVSLGQLPGQVGRTVEGVLAVFGADFSAQPRGLALAGALLHLAGVAAVAAAAVLAARRWWGGALDRVSQILLAGLAIDLAAYLLNGITGPSIVLRFLVPVLVFGAILLGRLAGPLISGSRPRTVLAGALLAGYLAATLAGVAGAEPAPPPTAKVQAWLASQRLTEGFGDYWQSTVITASSHGKVKVRPVIAESGRIRPYTWLADKRWYTAPRRAAHFVVLDERAPTLVDRQAIIAAFGAPDLEHHVGGFTILVWPHRDLHQLVS